MTSSSASARREATPSESEPYNLKTRGSRERAMQPLRDVIGFGEKERRNFEALLPMALTEDLDQVGDITTTATIPSQARGSAILVARSPGVLAGLPVAERLAAEFQLL